MKVVSLTSGGMDSVTMAHLLHTKHEVTLLHINYGQAREFEELRAVDMVSSRLCLSVAIADIRSIRDFMSWGSPASVVRPSPSRNLVFLSVAGAYAVKHGMDAIAIGLNADAYELFPDCRPEFLRAFESALQLGNVDCDVKVIAPLIGLSKIGVVALGDGLDVDWTRTWSCYYGSALHCGECRACRSRHKALVTVASSDPTRYSQSPAVVAPTRPDVIPFDSWK